MRKPLEEAFRGEWRFGTVEMVKRNSVWYAHFVLYKTVTLPDDPETIVAIDRGEVNLAERVG